MTAESLFGRATPTTVQVASFHTTLPCHLLNTALLITDTHTLLPLNSAVPKQHEVGTPMSSSGKSMNLKAVHAAGPKKRN